MSTFAFAGGVPEQLSDLPLLYRTGFVGCIHRLTVENKKVEEDDSGLSGFGAVVDFTNRRLVKAREDTVACVDQCILQ